MKTSLQPRARWFTWALVIGVALLFLPTLSGGFLWDDLPLIRDNTHAHSWAELGRTLRVDFWDTSDPSVSQFSGYYRPVVKLAFLASWMVGGGSPLVFHLLNLLLHVACCALVFRWLLRRLSPTDEAVWAAMAGALLFAVHPSRPESVAWNSGSTDLWMTLFILLGFTAWDRWGGRKAVIATAGCFLLATLSKEAAVLAPLLLISDAILLRPEPRRWRSIFAVSALTFGGALARSLLMRPRVSSILSFGWTDLVERTLASLALYARTLVVPLAPSVLSGGLPQRADGTFVYPSALVAAGAVIACLALLSLGYALRRSRPAAADAFHLLIPLAPVLNLVPLHYLVLTSERFLYWPMLGACALLSRALLPLLGRVETRRIAGGAFVAIAIVMAWRSSTALPHFASDRALWSYEHSRHPDAPYAAEMLALALWSDSEEPEQAIQLAAEALMHEQVPQTRLTYAVRWADIVIDMASANDLRRLQQARRVLDQLAEPERTSLEFEIKDGELNRLPLTAQGPRPTSQKGFATYRALAHARTFDLAGAEQLFRAQVQSSSATPGDWANLATVLATEEKWAEAEETLAAAERRVGSSPSLKSLGERLASLRRRVDSAHDPITLAVARADAFLALGAPELARSVLASVPLAPATLLTRARIAMAERNYPESRQVLELGKRTDPAHREQWDELARALSAVP